MPIVEILIGNIASGKSTYCKQRAAEGAIIINDDAIVNALHSNIYQKYDSKYKSLYKGIENHILTHAITLGLDVVVDRGLNLTPKSRKRFIGLAHSLDVPVYAVVFKFCDSKIHAERRMKHDSRGYSLEYWLKVAEYKNDQFIPPQEYEHFDRIIKVDEITS